MKSSMQGKLPRLSFEGDDHHDKKSIEEATERAFGIQTQGGLKSLLAVLNGPSPKAPDDLETQIPLSPPIMVEERGVNKQKSRGSFWCCLFCCGNLNQTQEPEYFILDTLNDLNNKI